MTSCVLRTALAFLFLEAVLGLNHHAAVADTIDAESILLRVIDRIDVPARAAGVLQAVTVLEGQRVEAGAPLAQIDDKDARLMREKAEGELELARMNAENDVLIRSAEAALKFAQAEVQRLEDANRGIARTVSQSQLAEAQEKFIQRQLDLTGENRKKEVAIVTQRLRESDVRLSQRSMELRQITAPQSGTIIQVYKRIGEWVEPGEKVVQIVRVDRLRAEGFIPADKVVGDLVGSSVNLTAQLPGRGSDEFRGKIVFVHPEIDPVNGQMRVWADIDNAGLSLRPGMRASMKITPHYGRAGTIGDAPIVERR